MSNSIIDRRLKYSGNTSKINHTNKTINKNLDINVLNILCSYVMCNNRNVRKGGYINLRNFMECLNIDIFKSEPDKLLRINFIKKGLDARIKKNLTNPTMILNYINGGFIDNNMIDISVITELSNDEIDFVNEMVTQSLQFTFIDEEIDLLSDLCIQWKASDFTQRSQIQAQLMDVVERLHAKFRQTRVEPMNQITFALRPDKFEEAITDVYHKAIDPSRRMITGMQGFNELIGGAFQASRFYLLLGLTGVGKSLTMLDIAIQIKKYNKQFTAKDPTKRPCVVYLTMENDIVETVERLFQITTGLDMTTLSLEDVIQKIKTDGELYINDNSPIDIIIKFIPDRSVDTGYLYLLTEDLEDDGYEVVCFMLDHIKRIRSSMPYQDIRLELGAVVNECKTFASIKDLIFISDSHLNRDAAATIDKNSGNTKADLTKLLGKANVGESMLMLDNSDWSAIINVEYDSSGAKYIIYKRVKMRYKSTNRNYICQPYEPNNPIKQIEDLYSSVPVFKDSLYDIDYSNLNVNTHMSTIRTSPYCTIGNLDTEDLKAPPINVNKTVYTVNTAKQNIGGTRYIMNDEAEKVSNMLTSPIIYHTSMG